MQVRFPNPSTEKCKYDFCILDVLCYENTVQKQVTTSNNNDNDDDDDDDVYAF